MGSYLESSSLKPRYGPLTSDLDLTSSFPFSFCSFNSTSEMFLPLSPLTSLSLTRASCLPPSFWYEPFTPTVSRNLLVVLRTRPPKRPVWFSPDRPGPFFLFCTLWRLRTTPRTKQMLARVERLETSQRIKSWRELYRDFRVPFDEPEMTWSLVRWTRVG